MINSINRNATTKYLIIFLYIYRIIVLLNSLPVKRKAFPELLLKIAFFCSSMLQAYKKEYMQPQTTQPIILQDRLHYCLSCFVEYYSELEQISTDLSSSTQKTRLSFKIGNTDETMTTRLPFFHLHSYLKTLIIML